ncbi:MAG: arylesterase [Flavisolibacter sp.]|nr:arylesterase [Flavisolibacter sp.]
MIRIRALLHLCFWMIAVTSCSNKQSNGTADATKAAPQDTASGRSVKTILFFGNSLTAGYGLDNPAQAFPALIQEKIDSLHLPYKVVNAGVSGETSSGGNSRVDWILKQPVDVFVLELGANDGLRGVPVAETKRNLQAIMDKVKRKYPNAKLVLVGMQVPPNMGQKYTTDFRSVFPELARKNGADLVPFLLEGVGGEAKFNQPDGIHPTAEGHRILAETVWQVLKDIL